MVKEVPLATRVEPFKDRLVPIDIVSGPPSPVDTRPSSVCDGIASAGCTPANTCARVIFSAVPLWLINSSSVSDAAVAGASWSIVGIAKFTYRWTKKKLFLNTQACAAGSGDYNRVSVLIGYHHTGGDLNCVARYCRTRQFKDRQKHTALDRPAVCCRDQQSDRINSSSKAPG